MRTEKDSLGTRQIPDDAYYGIHSLRSFENFNSAGQILPLELIHSIALLKWACACSNMACGELDQDKGTAIAAAARRVCKGEFDSQFNLDTFQSGSGTSSHMNVNEVISNIACEAMGGSKGDRALIHPNDHVNMGQSTNNVFPSAIKITAIKKSAELIEQLHDLTKTFEAKACEFEDIKKSGRTHLQDAVPMTLGQEFAAYANVLSKTQHRLREARKNLFELGVGGNAIGTGINTHPDFQDGIMRELRHLLEEPFVKPENGIATTQFLTDIAQMSSACKLLALDLLKITNDLRLLSSGPNTGLGEINLPAVEPGSSIMPGKINPSICEAANMACLQVIGYDYVISAACGAGQLELNTHMPLIGHNIIQEMEILNRTCISLNNKCVNGITANQEVCLENFERSAGLATILNPKLGYDKVAALVKEAKSTNKTIQTLVIEKELLSKEEWDELF